MRAAPVAGESQVRVIRTCGSCAHAPDDRPANWERGTGGEIDDPASPPAPRGVREGRPMTPARTDRPLRVATLDSAIAALRAGGLRVSAARRLVLEALFAAREPVSAERVAEGLGGQLPSSDLASVYRNLDTLEALGIVRHVHLGHGPGRYALTGGHAPEYVTCECCGAHVRLAPDALEAVRDAVRDACGYEARFSHFPIVGTCPACADAED
jgi:Fur family transcriptional regulator, ferric uptake regulator